MAATKLAVNAQDDGNDWDSRYPTGGLPAQPFRVIIPDELPTIITPRLRLRGMKPEDAEGVLAMWLSRSGAPLFHSSRPDDPPPSVEGVKAWMARKIFTEPPLAAGRNFQFLIFERDDPTGKIIGGVGLNVVTPLPNVGYGIHYDYWGKGYATEALQGLLETWWALPREGGDLNGDGETGTLKREKILACASKANGASVRVLEKCGFEVYREHEYEDGGVICCLSLEMPDKEAVTKN